MDEEKAPPGVITILCPRLSCRAVLRVPATVRGKRVRCGECGTAFLVPEQKKQRSAIRPAVAESKPEDA